MRTRLTTTVTWLSLLFMVVFWALHLTVGIWGEM
jgi:hypothetical protein